MLALMPLRLAAAEPAYYDPRLRQIDPVYQPVYAFFLALGQQASPEPGSVALPGDELRLPLDVPAIMGFIPKTGLQLSDVNWDGPNPWRLRHRTLEDALLSGEGPIYRRFKHLAVLASIPYRQYSQLRFNTAGAEVTVKVADWYLLTFDVSGPQPLLKQLDYLTLEAC